MKNVLFLSNHDISRIYSVLGEDINKVKMAIAFTLTTRGMVQWYYGDEIGMKNFSHPEDGKVREDFQGGWAADGINKFDYANLSSTEKNLYDYVQSIAIWRKNSAAIKSGKLMQFIPENGVYVYFRYTDTETIMVVLNTDKNAYTPDVKRFAERLNGFNSATDVVTGTIINGIANINVEGMQSGIYILKK